jgi:DNA invertase Pin-like site-specific DNA recombinase
MDGATKRISAVLYAAKSTPDEKESNVSQLEECRSRALGELGRLLVSEHHEANKSGWKGDRGDELEAALKAAEAAAEQDGHAELWVWKSERLARGSGRKDEARSLLEVFTRCKRAGVTLRSVIDDAYVQDEAMVGMASKMAEKYSADLSVNVAKGMNREAKKGRHLGPPPFGYRRDGTREESRLVVVPEEAAIVRRIFSEYVAGRSLSDIAVGLHRDGVRTKKGTSWRQSTVSGIVRNPVYTGKLTHRGETLDAIHEPILDAEVWERAAQLVAAAPKKRGRPPKEKRHLFTGGFLRCGVCGEAMVPRTRPESGYEYYECNGRKLYSCLTGAIRRADIDAGVLAHFEQTALDVEATREQVIAAMDRKAAEAKALLAAAEREAQGAVARLARIKRDYTHGELSAAEWRELRGELEPEATAAEAEAERLREQVSSADPRAALGEAEAEVMEQLAQLRATVSGDVSAATDVEAVRAVLMRLFERFVFHPEVPAQAYVELIGNRYWIEPVMNERAIAGYDEKMEPVLVREPLEQAGNNYAMGSPSRYTRSPE